MRISRSNHPRQPYRVRCRDETGFLLLVFFHAKGDYLTRLLPVGATRIVSGQVEHFNNQIQITHPDYIVAPEERATLKPIEPVYGLTAGLTAAHRAERRRCRARHARPIWPNGSTRL